MIIILKTLFWALAAFVFFATLAPLTSSQEWWIRGWDFPRVHLAVIAIATAVLGVAFVEKRIAIVMAVLVICAAYHAIRIFPYTPWAATEILIENDVPEVDQVSLISANILMQNEDHDAVRQMIADEQPDVLFLMETDQVWVDALAHTLSAYETVISYPLENHYGLIFATNLPVIQSDVVFLSDDKTPAILASLETPTGPFFFVGLHPRPPVPGQDTDARDEQIRRAALLADRKVMPVVAMGDFNDVAWSWTSERFKAYGAFRDPRVGRGMLPSFDATSWWMRYPIDQLVLTEGLGLISFSRLDPVGSDHFPMKAVITVKQSSRGTEPR